MFRTGMVERFAPQGIIGTVLERGNLQVVFCKAIEAGCVEIAYYEGDVCTGSTTIPYSAAVSHYRNLQAQAYTVA